MNKINLRDFYLRYPYKCYDLQSSTIPVPYVKKSELECDNPNTQTYQKYKEVVETIFSEIEDILVEGHTYKFPKRMGLLQMFKYKTHRKFRFVNNGDGTSSRIKNKSPHTNEHYPVLRWGRSSKDCLLWTKWHFSIKIMSKLSRKIAAKIAKQPSIIFQYSDAIKKNKS